MNEGSFKQMMKLGTFFNNMKKVQDELNRFMLPRKLWPRKKSKANYFTKETEEYIVKYNTSTDPDYRAKIFTDHIYLTVL